MRGRSLTLRAVQRLGITGTAPLSLIYHRLFSLPQDLFARTASGDQGRSLSRRRPVGQGAVHRNPEAQRPTFADDNRTEFCSSAAQLPPAIRFFPTFRAFRLGAIG
jgi:hypothetical protein